MKKEIIKLCLLELIGIFLYGIASQFAYMERGYEAIGGEVFFLFLPLFYCLIVDTINGFKHD